MTLPEALAILAQCHTRDDGQAGFVVETIPNLGLHIKLQTHGYVEAWRVVRMELGLPAGVIDEALTP